MVIVNNVKFGLKDESDLFKSFIIFKLTLSSTGKSVILANNGTMLNKLKMWLGERKSHARLMNDRELAGDLSESEIIYIETLWCGNSDLDTYNPKRFIELYDRMYQLVGEQRTYKPYGYNDLRISYHEGGKNATGAVMRLRVKEGLHRVLSGNGEVAFVKCETKQKRKPRSNYKILQYDLEYNFIREWDSMSEIIKEYKFRLQTLRKKASQTLDKSSGEVDNVLGGYRWFSSYQADWYEEEQESGGGWKYVGKYDLNGYAHGNQKNLETSNGKRRKGWVHERRKNPKILTEENKESLLIMGGLING